MAGQCPQDEYPPSHHCYSYGQPAEPLASSQTVLCLRRWLSDSPVAVEKAEPLLSVCDGQLCRNDTSLTWRTGRTQMGRAPLPSSGGGPAPWCVEWACRLQGGAGPRKRAQAEDRVFAGRVPTTFIMRKVHAHGNRETLFFHHRLGRHPRHWPAVCPGSQCGCHGRSLTWCSRSRLRGLTTGPAGASGLSLRTPSLRCGLPTRLVRSRWRDTQGALSLGDASAPGVSVLSSAGPPPRPVPASATGPASPPTRAGHRSHPRCSRGDGDGALSASSQRGVCSFTRCPWGEAAPRAPGLLTAAHAADLPRVHVGTIER